jgi:hypothetical protein
MLVSVASRCGSRVRGKAPAVVGNGRVVLYADVIRIGHRAVYPPYPTGADAAPRFALNSPRSGEMRLTACCTAFIAASALLAPFSCPRGYGDDAPLWKAGAAKVVITPTEPVWMAGYASRKGPSEGVLLDLHAKALALADADGRRLVIVTLDLISIPTELRQSLTARMDEQYGLKPDEVLLNVSHTHCGPMVNPSTIENWGIDTAYAAKTAAYVRQLEARIVDLAGQALANLQPSRIGYSHARCGFAMNRRLPTPSGYQNSPYPGGPVDHDVPVLRVESPDGKLTAVLFGYACHNTTLGIQQINGDYAGFAQRDLEAAHPGTIALFLMGCGGDQNPYPRGKVEQAEQHGRTLANAVEAALLPAAVPLEPHLATSLELCSLAFAPLPDKARLSQRAESSNAFEARHARRVLKLLEEHGENIPDYDLPVQVVRLGRKLTLAAIGGETVVDFSLRLKQELSQKDELVWVAGYSNEITCYIPSRRVLLEGGYEGGGAMTYTSLPGPFEEDVEERIVASVHRQAAKLRQR